MEHEKPIDCNAIQFTGGEPTLRKDLPEILKIAKEHKIPIDFNCENGECGTCVIKTTRLNNKTSPMAGPLTEKEKDVLVGLKKMTKDEVDTMRVNDFPPTWRLACQIIVRDEDMLVEY